MPNAIINLRMKPISQRRGFSTISLSTVSVAMVVSGKSVNKLVSRICLGSRGRKGKKSDAPAMLNIFPKLALVAIKTYFMVLAKVLRPSFTPSTSASRSFSRSTISAVSLATSAALSTEIPTSAAWSAEASLMPSPIYPTTSPLFLSARIILLFLDWLYLGKDIGIVYLLEQSFTTHLSKFTSGYNPGVLKPNLSTDAGSYKPVVSGNNL